jgi:hypothetical protein
MKSTKKTHSGFAILKMQFFFLLITTFAFADEYYDDLPPEFGLDDDPPPGTPIDFMIPLMIGIMLISLLVYFYKTRQKEV